MGPEGNAATVTETVCSNFAIPQIPSGNLGMFGNSGAAQARTMQQPQQPPVQPLNSSQPSLRAQVPQFLSPQVRLSYVEVIISRGAKIQIPSQFQVKTVRLGDQQLDYGGGWESLFLLISDS